MTRTGPITPTDVDTCIGLGVEAFRPVFASFEDSYGPDLFARLNPDWERTLIEQARAACANDETMVAEVDREVVGFVVMTMDKEDGLGAVGLIAVSPNRQRLGGGGDLLADALDRTREAGMAYATAYTRDHPGHLAVRRLLAQAGFSPLGVQSRSGAALLREGGFCSGAGPLEPDGDGTGRSTDGRRRLERISSDLSIPPGVVRRNGEGAGESGPRVTGEGRWRSTHSSITGAQRRRPQRKASR